MKREKNKMRFKKNGRMFCSRWKNNDFFEKKHFLCLLGLDKIKNLFIINIELRKRLTEC